MEDSAALASRLELLSSTAMMKKVLDRAGQLTDAPQTNSVQQPRREIDLASKREEAKEQPEPHRHVPGALAYSHEASSHHPVLTERPMQSTFAHSLLLRSAYDRYGNSSAIAPPLPAGCSPGADDTPYRGQAESSSLQFHHPAGTTAWIPALSGYHPGVAGNEAYFFDPNLAAASASPAAAAAAASAIRYRTKENITPIQMNAHPIQLNPPPPGTAARQSMLARNMAMENVKCAAMYAPQRTTNEEVDPSAAGGVVRPSYEALANENIEMRRQLREKEAATIQLQERIASLENQISELRQLPTGKISHIPIE